MSFAMKINEIYLPLPVVTATDSIRNKWPCRSCLWCKRLHTWPRAGGRIMLKS